MPTSLQTIKNRRRRRRVQQHLKESIRVDPDRPVVLSEGDSWFCYPDHRNVVDHLDDVGNMSLLRLESNGDEVVEILAGKQRAKLRRVLTKFPFDAILFSGGGNDIVGQDFEPLLVKQEGQTDAASCIAHERLAERLTLLRQVYVELVRLRDETHAAREEKHATGKPKPLIVTHGYDRPVPRDEGYKALGRTFAGPWMYGALKRKKIPKALWRDVAAFFIDRFGDLQRRLAAQFDRFAFVETAGTLRRSGSGWKNDWSDEIHPSDKGYQKVGEKLRERLRAEFPGYF